MDAGFAAVFAAVFWAAVDEAAAEDLDFAGEVFPVALALLVFLVVEDFALVAVDFALVVVDFALVATDLDLGAGIAAFWTAEFAFFRAVVGRFRDGDAESFGISITSLLADFDTTDLGGADFCIDVFTVCWFELNGLEETMGFAS